MSTPASVPSHLSIGEVLSHLRDEFPDITISKIRFLESQGLIDPERTPSGYRKFYEGDVARLRWILHQQRENFLPLRVIKERLDHIDFDHPRPEDDDGQGSEDGGADARDDEAAAGSDDGGVLESVVEVAVEPSRPRAFPTRPAFDPASSLTRESDEPETATLPTTRTAASGGVSLTRAELAKAAGLEVRQIAELESFGLLVATGQSDEQPVFDEEGLAVARAAAGFARHGIEARHLRMFKHFAQREADLMQQVLLPYLRQRNPQARAKAQADLAELATLGRSLRAALLVSAVREALAD